MSNPIQNYYRKLDDLRRIAGADNEGGLRSAFQGLLENIGNEHQLILYNEYPFKSPSGTTLRADGVLVDRLRLVHGWWEAKDEKDDLNKEIEAKLAKGYPQDNIIFEDTHTAVLMQHGEQVMRCPVHDAPQLQRLLDSFFNYQLPDVENFRLARTKFLTELPHVAEALTELLSAARLDNAKFRQRAEDFLQLCKRSIGERVTSQHVDEMLIQHILTDQIFRAVFPDSRFHAENHLAHAIGELENSFFRGETRINLLKRLEPYFAAIRLAAAKTLTSSEKQDFLKQVYEDFYSAYNPKDADKLGVVYTPQEAVRFMIEGCDWLSQQHFGKRLADSGLDILDPCMGTGTFIVDLLDYWRGDHHALSYKFANEVHANEISILPYYIASLNIEQTYYEITEQWREFSGACFVNTLDNWGFKQTHSGANMDIFGSLTDENHARIEAQNARNIPIIIGNPPYNANQQNENDNNKNDAAPTADKRIKDTYLAESTAQKTKLYDPYIRFFRWASDRLGEQGILAFITNRSYLDSRQADGFRKTVAKEFQAIWIIDLMSDVRKNPKISGTKHNIFGIQAGVAIVFLVRTASPLRTGSPALDSEIHYLSLDDFLLATEKRAWLKNHSLRRLAKAGQFRQITPNKQGTWLNQAQEYDDWNSWLPIASKEAKLGKTNEVIFKLHSLGVVTARDEWICGHSEAEVSEKTRTLIEMYQAEQKRWKKSDHTMNIEDFVNRSIKWTTELTAHLVKGTQLKYRRNFIVPSMYRPFVENFLYYDKVVVHRTYQQTHIFPIGAKRSASSACNVGEACTPANLAIGISGNPNAKPFQTLVVASLPCYDLLEKTQFLPLWIYDKDGSRHENITDHALKLFQAHYYASQKSFLGRYKYILCNPKTFLGRYKNILYKTKSISDDTKTFYTNPKSISDSTKPSNTSSASFSESTKPSNTISAGISDSKAPSNTISASISDSKAPSNTISACISDSKAPSNTSSASISDSTAPSNTISACISDSTAPFNTSSADISDSTKPSDTSSVGISDSTALSNTISASNSDSTKPSDTSSASISDNTEALTASSECISDGIKTSDTNTESISVVPMCGENQNLRGFKNLAGLNTDLNKTDIFNYVYAVLHDPRYRQKFALNLKAEFPRIPFHPNFSAWAAIGEKLIKLHAHFEQVEPWEFDRRDAINRVSTKCRLKADKINHCIEIDSDTTLSNIPPEAWQYQLGNRSALEWVLDQYKEKTPKDPTIREKFNTYRFADHKEEVIELLAKVCRVSVDTVALVAEIEKLPWD